MTGDQPCHYSFPADSSKNSELATCRTLPDSYIEGEWDFDWELGGVSKKMKGQCPKKGCPLPDDYDGEWKQG